MHYSKLLVVVSCLIVTGLFSQKNDYNWILNDNGIGFNKAFISKFDTFPNNFEIISNTNFQRNISTLSDSSGKLLVSFNQFEVTRHSQTPILGGDSISNLQSYKPEESWLLFTNAVAIGLNIPLSTNKYLILLADISKSNTTIPSHSFDQITSCEIIDDMQLGVIVNAKNQIVEDLDLAYTHLQLVKHANGRDYWLFALSTWFGQTHSSPYMYMHSYLIDSAGVHPNAKQKFDGDFGPRVWQFVASPDGNLLATVSSSGTSFPPFQTRGEVLLFQVDRCNGTVNLTLQYNADEVNGQGLYGCAFSPNSRFLYFSTSVRIWQQDLAALPTIEIDTIVKLNYDPNIPSTWNLHGFNRHQRLGPDGRIYISQYNSLGIIERPNEKGVACTFRPKAIPLNLGEQTYYVLPHYPEYRLGPIDGSACDTLGIDNCVLGNFHWYSADSNLTVDFIDNSTYGPQSWNWSFGDGTMMVSDTNPVHTFPAAGIYQVCMMVSNDCRTDTICQNVEVFGISPVVEFPNYKNFSLTLGPNPANAYVAYQYALPTESGEMSISDMMGRLIEEISLNVESGMGQINLQQYKAGVYTLSLRTKESRLTAKLIVY
jgi:hypothetical protein